MNIAIGSNKHYKPQISDSSSDDDKEEKKNDVSANNQSDLPLMKNSSSGVVNNLNNTANTNTNTNTNENEEKQETRQVKKKKKTVKKKGGEKIEEKKVQEKNDNKFTIIHNEENEKKKLENSYEDYYFYEIVSDESFQKFIDMTKTYIANRIKEKIQKLYNNLKKLIIETIMQTLKKIHSHSDAIQKIVSRTISYNKKNPTLCQKLCSCCCKEKPKLDLKNDHDMRNRSEEFDQEICDFASSMKSKFNSNEMDICKIDEEETDKFAKEKAEVFFMKKGMKERLRLEVDSYCKYFNIEQILEIQNNTLNKQQKKLQKLNEIKEMNVCIICMEKQRNIMFIPCYHLICCETCSKNVIKEECPECKTKITEKISTD